MAIGKGIHIDEQNLAFLEHDVLGVIIAMDHFVDIGNGRDKAVELFGGFAGEIGLKIIGPSQGDFLHIGHFARLDIGAMDLL
jgi:hypothetical protein